MLGIHTHMAPSLDENYGLLVVTVKSAALKTKDNRAKIYAYAYVHPKGRLRTKMCHTRCSNSTWDDKFVFSIPDCSFHGQGSSVFFKIYRACRGFADSLIGVAECDVKALFGGFGTEKKDNISEPEEDKGISEDECKYEIDAEDHCCEYEDPRYPNMFDGGESEANGDGQKEEARPKVFPCLQILKGSEMKGVLNVELEMGETICCLGKLQWKNMAMPYDEFMGEPIEAKKEKYKSLSWTCCFSTPKST